MDKFYVDVFTSDNIATPIEIPMECRVLWNENYTELFPEETYRHYNTITELVIKRFGNQWKGWALHESDKN